MAMNALETEDFENEGDDSLVRLHEQDHTENIYRSCCGQFSDKRLIVLLAQIIISAIIIIFSGLMLAIGDTATDKAIYMSLLSSTLSYWLGKNEDHARA